LPIIQQAQTLEQEKDENDLDIYLENEDEDLDELTLYFEEKRVTRLVSYLLSF
jgi:hypothetical protein